MRDYQQKHAMVKAARRYIDSHLHDTMDLEALASQYNCSYTAFRRTFLKICDFTPHQYIRLRCIHEAAQLLREGVGVQETAERVGFQTRAGFYKAFFAVNGVSPQEFLSSRGTALMTPPTLIQRPELTVVGYVLEPDDDFTPRDRGAYWLLKTFPDVSAEEYRRIGGSDESYAFWVDRPEGSVYILGPKVDAVRYVPAGMAAHTVPGGAFLEFPVPDSNNLMVLYENVLVTWYYARQQWLPDSPWEEDTSRCAYEYYGVNGQASVLIPVLEKRVS